MNNTLTDNSIIVNSNFNTPPDDPLLMLREWLELADKLKIIEPRGMVLSTVDRLNRPSSRVVLINHFDNKGIIFSTSAKSKKGKDLSTNSWASGTIWWRETFQQINLQGQVVLLSDEISDGLFQKRPREAQALSIVSNQSEPLINMDTLENNLINMIGKKGNIDRPDQWHAYHLRLESIEFWHGSKDRAHKRLRYDLTNRTWHHQQLQP